LDIGVLGYIGIVQHKEHSPEVLSIPPGTPCIFLLKISVLTCHRMANLTRIISILFSYLGLTTSYFIFIFYGKRL